MAEKMAFSSIFRRVNVKELISNVSVYTSATGNDFWGSLSDFEPVSFYAVPNE